MRPGTASTIHSQQHSYHRGLCVDIYARPTEYVNSPGRAPCHVQAPTRDSAANFRVRLFITFPDTPGSSAEPQSCLGAVRTLFHFVGENLRSLVVHCLHDVGMTMVPAFPGPFPVLRSVTLLGIGCVRAVALLPPNTDGLHAPAVSLPHTLFPAVTRLHMIFTSPDGSADTLSFGALAYHFPRITHLRMSNIDPSVRSRKFLADLATALPSHSPPSPISTLFSCPSPRTYSWPSIHSVVLQPCAPPRSEMGGSIKYGDPRPKEEYAALWYAMRQIESAATRVPEYSMDLDENGVAEVKIKLMEGIERSAEEWCETTRRVWARSVEDGWGEVDKEISPSTTSAEEEFEVAGQARSGWSHMTVVYPI
ncbi:hypothetical protein C8Q74DRAFT_1277400 [Fomes fomentarius]|nr:hypothetical protein C8Q74DRAFT_1277400 [Fomes fomentarius]